MGMGIFTNIKIMIVLLMQEPHAKPTKKHTDSRVGHHLASCSQHQHILHIFLSGLPTGDRDCGPCSRGGMGGRFGMKMGMGIFTNIKIRVVLLMQEPHAKPKFCTWFYKIWFPSFVGHPSSVFVAALGGPPRLVLVQL